MLVFYISAELIYTVLNIILRDNTDIVLFTNYEVFDNGEMFENSLLSKDGIYEREALITEVKDKQVYVHDIMCNKLYKSEIFDNLKFKENLKMYEDTDILPYVYNKAKTISVINKPYYYYCQNEVSVMHSSFADKNMVLIDIYNRHLKDFENTELYDFYLIKKLRRVRRMYLEAASSGQKQFLKTLSKEFNDCYRIMKKRKISASLQNRIAYFLFRLSPELYRFVLYNFK